MPEPASPGGQAPGGQAPVGEAPAGETGPSTLLTVAPAATDLPHLLRTAIDAEQVGAARIHLAADQADAGDAVAAIRAQTRLVITTDPGGSAAGLTDLLRPDFVEQVLVASLSAPQILTELSALASEHTDASVGGRGAAAIPVLLAALAVGLHVRVGTSDLTGAAAQLPAHGPRDDIALIARAAGLARIAGRPAMPIPQARSVLGLS